MTKNDGKKAFEQANKELREKQIENLKHFIKKTLQKKESLIAQRKELARAIEILDKDIDDLKDGRIDRVEERQKTDPAAREASVAVVEKERVIETTKEVHHHHYDRWYAPYRFTWTWPAPVVYCDNSAGQTISSNDNTMQVTGAQDQVSFSLNNSLAADFTQGVYKLSNGTIKYVG